MKIINKLFIIKGFTNYNFLKFLCEKNCRKPRCADLQLTPIISLVKCNKFSELQGMRITKIKKKTIMLWPSQNFLLCKCNTLM